MMLIAVQGKLFILFRQCQSRCGEASPQLPSRFSPHMGSWSTIRLASQAASTADLALPAPFSSVTSFNGARVVDRASVDGSDGSAEAGGPGFPAVSLPPQPRGRHTGHCSQGVQGKASCADHPALDLVCVFEGKPGATHGACEYWGRARRGLGQSQTGRSGGQSKPSRSSASEAAPAPENHSP